MLDIGWVGKARAMAREFQSSFEAMARDAELDKVRDEINKVGRTDFRRTIEKQVDPTGELGSAFDIGGGKKRADAAEPDAGSKPAPAAGENAPTAPAKASAD
jgi:sec-independent protein translocase protein TatB